ncbi:hypothetical protein TWF694_003787 [Orbilia ellipsospora]|uniref:CHAT domain-containing protein n=1 Tax=Orbilia ellipsospora TaxID=2528407 RepID=A0AAV9WZK6_9PEZI
MEEAAQDSIFWCKKYFQTGDVTHLNQAIRIGEQEVESVPENHDNQLEYLSNLSRYYVERFQKLKDNNDLDTAIILSEKVVNSTPLDNHGALANRLSNLSKSYHERYDRFGKPEDLSLAIEKGEKAAEIYPSNNPNLPNCKHVLSVCYMAKFEKGSDPDDLGKATQYARQATDTSLKYDPNFINYRHQLSICYNKKFDQFKLKEDSDNAIQISEAILQTANDLNGRSLAPLYDNISSCYNARFKIFKDNEDLQEAIRASQNAVQLSLPNDPNRASRLSKLSNRYSLQFAVFGKQEDINKAIDSAEEAVNIPGSSRLEIPEFQINLSNHYKSRFDWLGDPEDLEKSIDFGERALDSLTPGHQDKAACLSNLSNSYGSRFRRFWDHRDIDEAIKLAQDSIEATPADSQRLGARYNNLSVHYSSKFHKLKKKEYIDEAIENVKKALDNFHERDPERTTGLSSHSIFYNIRYKHFGNQDDINEAIRISNRAIEESNGNVDISTPKYHHNLAIHYTTTFNGAMNENFDLDKALKASLKAVNTTPLDSIDRAERLTTLSNIYAIKYDKLKDRNDLQEAILHMRAAFAIEHVSPLSRIQRGMLLSELFSKKHDYHQAAGAARDATLLFPRISPRYLPRRDHEDVLSEASEISSRACSLALLAGNPAYEAFILLEIGRAVMASLAIDFQTDSLALREQYPQLYKRYEDLRYRLSAIRSSDETSLANAALNLDRFRSFYIEQGLTTVEAEIRQKPGFATFQQPPSLEDLRKMAKEGPIVALNVTALRSDALIITTTGVHALPLPNLAHDEATRHMSSMKTITKRSLPVVRQNNEHMRKLLEWLWKSAVEPVLRELGFLNPSSDSKLPHIWWITNGIMSSAPLHAAGIYNMKGVAKEKESAVNCVISSFISTTKALKFAREKILAVRNNQQPAVQVNEEDAEGDVNDAEGEKVEYMGEALLICASDEIGPRGKPKTSFEKEIPEIIPAIEKCYKATTLKDSPREEVLEQIKQSSIIHFACHGKSVGFDRSAEPPLSPSNSYLLLKGSLRTSAEKLTINDLAKVTHPKAQLAYLSACSTATISSEELRDEMIHIANAFQLAGYPHVIGTMWVAEDGSARKMAAVFYKNLLAEGSQNMSYNVAKALHEARKEVMAEMRYKADFLAWATFIHIGA